MAPTACNIGVEGDDGGMPNTAYELGVYLHLARASQRRQRLLARDRLLLLAGATACGMHLNGVAAYCRRQVLLDNPHHLIRRWDSIEMALADEEFQPFLRQLKSRYPLAKAERMLDRLGIQMARERETYYSDLEYAAAVLNVSPASLQATKEGS